MLVKEIIQRIQSLYSKGVESDDTRLSSRHIYNKIISVRARLISQDAKKKQKISQWNYQTLPCVELIKVPAHDCPCIPPVGCDILRSKHMLPKPLSGLSGTLIQAVTSIDRTIKFSEISINAINSQKGNKYSSKGNNYFIENGYLYISTPNSKVGVIRIIGLFEDPLEVKKFESYCEDCKDCVDCTDYDEEVFPLDNDMVDTLIELSIQELVVMFGGIPEDTRNDNKDERT